MAATAPDQNTVPITAASWIMAFAYGSSMSTRAAIRPWTSIGTGISARGSSVQADPFAVRILRSLSSRTNSRAYRGLPADRDTMVSETTAGRTACSRRFPISRVVSRSDSGGRATRLATPGSCRPVREASEELWTGGRNEEHGARGRVVDDPVDEGKQGVVRPMQVLEHEHGRVGRGQGHQEPLPGSEVLLARRLGGAESDQWTKALPEPWSVGVVVCDHGIELGSGQRRRIGLQDPGLSLDDLAECPERDPFPIRQAASLPPADAIGYGVEERAQLGNQPALAHTRLPDDRDQPDRAVPDRPFERVLEKPQLRIPADQWAGRRPGDVGPESRPGSDGAPDRDGLGPALDRGEVEGLIVEDPLGGSVRRLGHDDPAFRRDGLEAGSDVRHIADDDASGLVMGTRADQGLTGVHTDPHGELQHGIDRVQVGDLIQDPQGGANRSFRVVLMGDRRAEHPLHSVTDELLDRPAVRL